MKRFDKRRVIASVVVAVFVVQVAAAGVAFIARSSAERDLVDGESRRVDLGVRIDMAESAQSEPEQKPDSGFELEDAPDVSGTLQAIQGLGDAAGVELTGLRARKSTTDGKQTFQITGAAAPIDVCEFLARLEQHEELLIVETGRIHPGTDAAIIFDLGIATYHATRDGGGQ